MITIRCTKEGKSHVSYTLLAGQMYSIGRKGGDISFPDDPSVSRNHAELTVEHPLANVSDSLLTPTVVVTDLGSKFGTFANDGIERKSSMAMREPMNLSPGDRFKFGMQWNEFKIEYTPLIVTPSTIKDPLKLKNVIMMLAGHVLQEWSDKCNYVAMESLTLTVKAICALLSAKHIVTPAFFDDLLECVKTKKGRPDPNNYLPPLGEKVLTASGLSFKPNVSRTQLFEGKTFLFSSNKQIRKVGVAVKCGGGTCALISSVSTRDLLNDNYIIITPSDRDMATMDTLQYSLAEYKKKKRTVSESEIGLAAVYNSTEKHCNPRFSFTDAVFPKLASQTQNSSTTSAKVIVPETQQQTQMSTQSDSINVIDETIVENVKKEPKSETNDPGTSRSTKRNVNGKDKEPDAPSTKKRSAEDTEPSSSTKRHCWEMQSEKALSALFGLSDDEDEEIIVPDSQEHEIENESTTLQPNADNVVVPVADMDIVPDSPPPVSNNLNPNKDGASRSPVTSIEEPRTSRSRSKIASQNEVNEQGSEQTSSSKRKLRGSDGSDANVSPQYTSKKRKTKEREIINKEKKKELEVMAKNIENLTLQTEMKENEEKPLVPPPIRIRTIPLLTGPKYEPKILMLDGKSVKNYKSFAKVLPLSQQGRNVQFVGSSNSSRNSSNRKSLTFKVYGHAPNTPEPEPLPYPFPQVRPAGEPEPANKKENHRNIDEMRSTATASTSSSDTSTRSRRTRSSQREDSPPAVPVTSKRLRSALPIFPHPAEEEDENDIWRFE